MSHDIHESYRVQAIKAYNSQSYKQFGNSVSVNVLQNILLEIAKIIDTHE